MDSLSLCSLAIFSQASLCRFKRNGVYLGLHGFTLFLCHSLLFVRLVTSIPEALRCSCSSSRITCGLFWTCRPNVFVDHGEIFLVATVSSRFSMLLRVLNRTMEAVIVVKGIFRLQEIVLWILLSFKRDNICYFCGIINSLPSGIMRTF